MKKQNWFLGAGLALTSFSLVAQSADPAVLRKQALEVISPIPDQMPGAEKDTKVRIDLGKKLFFEKRLSKNQTQSCNSCHSVDQGRGGVDNEPTSPGAFGKRGGRNSPTVLNAGFHLAQFWDGRGGYPGGPGEGADFGPVRWACCRFRMVISPG